MLAVSRICAVRLNHSNNPAFRAAVLVALVLIGLLPTAQAAWEPEKLGRELTALPAPVKAPDFSLKDMDDTSYNFADYRGKVVLLNFWATWCPPCRREMPSMERLHEMLDSDGFKVIAINQMESPDHVFAYTGQLEIDPTFPILFDRDSSAANAYRVKGLPTTYLIDKQGMIRYRAIGGREFDHPDVVKVIKQLINE